MGGVPGVLEEVRNPDEPQLEIDFYGFLRLMRWFADTDTERMLLREQTATKACGYTRNEVRGPAWAAFQGC